MKKMLRGWLPDGIDLLVVLIAGLACPALAQNSGRISNSWPIVTIRATDPLASESGDTGTFTLFRDGSTNSTLNVYYLIGGTASNGVDYATISPWTTIPAGLR